MPSTALFRSTSVIMDQNRTSFEECWSIPIRLHDLSRTCATILLMARKHQRDVQEFPGHASISITLDPYCHVIEGMYGGLDDAMDEAL